MSWSAAPPPNPYVVRAFEDPRIAHANAIGRRHTVYELLTEKRDASADPAERAALDELLRYRRNFVEPGSPGAMGSLNGVGVKLYGSQELDPRDGSFIATLYFIVVFIPIYPIAEYLVSRASSGLIRSSWHVYGKVPMSRGHRLWRKAGVGLAAAGAVGLIVVGGLVSHHKHQRADVWVTNDLEVPVAVSLGRASLTVDPHAFAVTRDVPKGALHVTVKRPDGRVIQEDDVVVEGGADATVVNVLGASPVFEEKVFYATTGKAPDSEAQVFAGERFVVRKSADYVFKDPPSTLSMDSSSKVTTRVHVGRAPEGLDVTLGYLIKQDPKKYSDFLRELARAEPEAESVTSRAIESIEGPDGQLAFLDELVALRKDDVDLHRKRQNLLVLLGRSGDALTEYKARYEADASVVNAYLYAAVMPRSEGRALLEQFCRDKPAAKDDPYVTRLLGAIAFQERRFADAVPLLEAVVKAPKQHQIVLSEHTGSLLVSKGPMAALSMLRRLGPDEKKSPAYWIVWGQAISRARVQKIDGADALDPASVVDADTLPEDWATLSADWGIEPAAATRAKLDVATKSALEVGLAARRDPALALDLFDKAAPQARSKVLALAALALATEAGRKGDDHAARALYAVAEASYGKDPVLEAFTLGGPWDEALDGEQMVVRAVVEFAASRREKDKKKRAALEAEAKLDDPLFGLVSDALASWPAP